MILCKGSPQPLLHLLPQISTRWVWNWNPWITSRLNPCPSYCASWTQASVDGKSEASEKHPSWRVKVKVKVAQLYLTLCNPMDYTVHGILQARILEWVAFPFSRGSSQPGNRTQVSHIAGGFFISWATKETQEYWSSLFLLQQIFLTQESNRGLLHCRCILYQLSHQGSIDTNQIQGTRGKRVVLAEETAYV